MLRPFLGLALFASLACGGIPGLPSTSSEPPPPPAPPPGVTTTTPTPAAGLGRVELYLLDCAYVDTVPAPGGAAGAVIPACNQLEAGEVPRPDPGGCAAKREACRLDCPAECRAGEADCTARCNDCKSQCGSGPDAAACLRACAEDRLGCQQQGATMKLWACHDTCGEKEEACVAAVAARAERECDTDCQLLRDCASGARPSGSEACNAVHRRASQFCQDACRP